MTPSPDDTASSRGVLPRIVSCLDDTMNKETDATSSTNPRFNNSSRLVVHFDINETILIGDEAGGDTREDCLNKILAKSAFVQWKSNDSSDTSSVIPTHWWDGTLIGKEETPPPLYTGWQWPPGCCPYYRTSFKKKSKQFTSGDGIIYKPLYDEMQRRLQPPNRKEPLNDVLDHLIPAFFHTLEQLTLQQRNFGIVLRTFGTDLPEIAQAISLFAAGKHPDHPGFVNKDLILRKDNLFAGKWKERDNGYIYELHNSKNELVASGDAAIVKLLESKTICGIQDDYKFWSSHDCEPWAGKPVWVPLHNAHHVLFDDNIHNLAHDSIAAVRQQQDQGEEYRALTGEEILDTQGLHLVRVPTIEPIMNPNWFLKQIDMTQSNQAAATRRQPDTQSEQ